MAKDLGISQSGLRRWMAQDGVDAGRLSTSERDELARVDAEIDGLAQIGDETPGPLAC